MYCPPMVGVIRPTDALARNDVVVDNVVVDGTCLIRGEGESVPALTAQQYIDKLLGNGVATVVSVAPVLVYNRNSGAHYYGLIYYRDNSLRAAKL